MHYNRDKLFVNNGAIDDFPADKNNSATLKYKVKIASRTGNDGTKMLNLEYD